MALKVGRNIRSWFWLPWSISSLLQYFHACFKNVQNTTLVASQIGRVICQLWIWCMYSYRDTRTKKNNILLSPTRVLLDTSCLEQDAQCMFVHHDLRWLNAQLLFIIIMKGNNKQKLLCTFKLKLCNWFSSQSLIKTYYFKIWSLRLHRSFLVLNNF